MTTATTEHDTFTLERPEDVSDGRWHIIQSMAHKMVTGHMPWCEEHRGTEDGGPGWCTAEVITFAATVEVHNCSNDGQIRVDLQVNDLIDEHDMALDVARAISAAIEMATDRVRDLTPPSEVKA